MSQKKIIDLGSKKIDLNDDDIPIALNYYGRLEVRDWEELFFVAVKCLFIEFPDVINNLCSKDPTQNLFLRTTTIGMKRPRRIAPIIFLETKRTPLQIAQALRKIFLHAGVLNINMQIEVMPPSTSKAEIEKIFSQSATFAKKYLRRQQRFGSSDFWKIVFCFERRKVRSICK